MIQRANTMIQRFALLLLLSCASLPLLASEGRMDSPDSDGDHHHAAMVTAPGDAVHGESPGDSVEAAQEKADESAPADSPEHTGRPPRMHNLIPGMFR